MGESLFDNFATGRFHTKKLCSRLYSTEIELHLIKQKIAFSSYPLGDLGVMYALYLQPTVDLFIIIERLRRYKRKSVEVGISRKRWVSLSAHFRQKDRRRRCVGVTKLE